ncbi:MAG: ribonuclease J [Candidatus Doudnabacteria bacterium]|nr:ribonuclease J [Candidatus Doudnabacteria bacterium]
MRGRTASAVRPQDKTASQPQRAASPQNSKDVLKVIPLGGIEEVGENMTIMEYGDDILVIDMGLGFPDETMPGIDYIIPNTKYLEENKKRIKGVIITHGHLDHIGAIPYILPKIGDPPIYTMKLTGELIKKRLEEFHLLGRSQIHELNKDDVLTLGNFRIRFFRINHNIPDGVGLAINTPAGLLVYATDWKFDHTPVDGRPTEFDKLAKFGGEGVALLLSDSTNAEKPGYSMSEKTLGDTIDRILGDAKGRVIFATFSTLISRVQQVIDAAYKSNRKIVVTGRSLVNNIEICLATNYLKMPAKNMIIKMEQAKKLPDNQVVIVTTGSQGEEASALARIARGEHKTIEVRRGDTVVVSASPIPGNERAVSGILSSLARQGAKVLYQKILDIHTSGHAYQEDLKLMISLTKPKYFMPIHGEHHMLLAHAELAKGVGVAEQNIFTLDNGQMLELSSNGVKVSDAKIPTGYVFVDGLGVGDVGEVVLRDRQVMSKDGMFVILMVVDKRTGKLMQQPDIISRGFIYMKGSEDLLKEVKHEVRKAVESKGKVKAEANWSFIRSEVRDQIGDFLFQRTERRPMVLPVVIEV